MHQKLKQTNQPTDYLRKLGKQGLSKVRLILTSLLVGTLLLFSIVFFLLSANPKQKHIATLPTPIVPVSVPTPIVATSLLSFKQETASTTAVILDTGNKPVSTVQLEIGFEPQILNNVTITPAQFFQKALVLQSNVDYTKGTIFFALVVPPGGIQKQGKGTVATISYTFTQGAINPTIFQFLSKTKVTTMGAGQSILKSAKGITVSSGL